MKMVHLSSRPERVSAESRDPEPHMLPLGSGYFASRNSGMTAEVRTS
jgi:hypothetical protein